LLPARAAAARGVKPDETLEGGSMRRVLVALMLTGLAAVPAQAQNLTSHFEQLFTFGTCGQPLCLDPTYAPFAEHGEHFVPAVAEGSHNLLTFVTGSITSSIASIPFATATGGVAFSFTGGAPQAVSISPGPIFAERAQTLGRGRFFLGGNVSGISFSKLRGIPLSNLVFTFPHQNVGDPAEGNPGFENDVIQDTTDLKVSVVATSLEAAFGVTDRIDLGVDIPIVFASLSGHGVAHIVQTSANDPHWFGTGTDTTSVAYSYTSGSASGLGDIAVRLKVDALESQGMGIGFVGEVRLPTGNQDDLLGSGATSFRLIGIASSRHGNFTPHVNAGVFITGSNTQNNELQATVGFDQLLSPKATLAVDLAGEFATGSSKLILPRTQTYTAPVVRTITLTNIPAGNDNVIDASVGGKFTLPGSVRLLANALVPLVKGGLQPAVMWTVGLERVF
jgi:hypothetical protein